MGLGIDIIIFITAILFGIFLYWRESNGNGVYRFINKIMNSKELQMSRDSKKGFIYQQPFIPRLLFVVILLLIVGLILQFLTPLNIFSNYFALSGFATFATGTLIGTYLANFVIKTTKVVEEKSDSLGDLVSDAVEKGKDLIEDLKPDTDKVEEEAKEDTQTEAEPEAEKKSARDRLKDKGLM